MRDVHIHRSIGGLSSDAEQLGRSFGMRGVGARQHHFVVAARIAGELAAGSPAFAPQPRLARAATAALAALLIVTRFPGLALARRVLERAGLDRVEPAVTAWVRKRD